MDGTEDGKAMGLGGTEDRKAMGLGETKDRRAIGLGETRGRRAIVMGGSESTAVIIARRCVLVKWMRARNIKYAKHSTERAPKKRTGHDT